MELTDLKQALARLPLGELRDALGDRPAYLVGGAVRDLLLGREPGHPDIAIDGEVEAVAHALGGEVRNHERFGTATVWVGDLVLDLARTRSETYGYPGALPSVEPAPLSKDLERRDFTVNAMAIPIAGDGELIDPFGGRDDLAAGLLRILHAESFVDDPTRALRAARYAGRLGFGLEEETARLLAAADLSTVSSDRVDAETLRIAADPDPWAAFGLLEAWGVITIGPDAIELGRRVAALITGEPWIGQADRSVAIHAAVLGHIPSGRRDLVEIAHGLAAKQPFRPSEELRAADGHDELELLLATAMGAAWAERVVGEWRLVELDIDGEDLLAAGIPQGPAIGRGLEAAMAAKVDGAVICRDLELEVALAAARGA